MDDISALARQIDGAAGDVAVLAQADHTLVMLHGDIDVRSTDDLEQAGRFAIDDARLTIMDVRNVTMMDSVGISFVIRLAASLRSSGTELVLRGPCARVAELLTLVGADGLVRWTSLPRIDGPVDGHVDGPFGGPDRASGI
jgi:anti-anti-sigma factor